MLWNTYVNYWGDHYSASGSYFARVGLKILQFLFYFFITIYHPKKDGDDDVKMFEWPRLCYPYEISFDFVVYQPAYYRRDRGLFRLDAVRDYFEGGSIFAVFISEVLRGD